VKILGAREPHPPGLAVGYNSSTKFHRSPPRAGFFAPASFTLGQGVTQQTRRPCGVRVQGVWCWIFADRQLRWMRLFQSETAWVNIGIASCKGHDISQATLGGWKKKKTAGH